MIMAEKSQITLLSSSNWSSEDRIWNTQNRKTRTQITAKNLLKRGSARLATSLELLKMNSRTTPTGLKKHFLWLPLKLVWLRPRFTNGDGTKSARSMVSMRQKGCVPLRTCLTSRTQSDCLKSKMRRVNLMKILQA